MDVHRFFSNPLSEKDIQELILRFDTLQSMLEMHSEIDAIYFTEHHFLQYYTGHSISYGGLYCERGKKPLLMLDGRYFDMLPEIGLWNKVLIQGSVETTVCLWLSHHNPSPHDKVRVAFQGNSITYESAQSLLKQSPQDFSWISTSDVFSQIRRIKSSEEKLAIQKSAHLCEEGFRFLLREIREGISEQELAHKLFLYWIERGAQKLSFDPIIAFGKNSALPHWKTSSSCLKKGDIILIDIGVTAYGYASDMTRTFSFGPPQEKEFDHWFSLAHTALESAEKSVQPGIPGRDIDNVVRQSFEKAGVLQHFLHGLGHGVGMEVHEAPRISQKASPLEGPLQVGDVITLEPGLYFQGHGGVRLENTYIVHENGLISCMKVPFYNRYEQYIKAMS